MARNTKPGPEHNVQPLAEDDIAAVETRLSHDIRGLDHKIEAKMAEVKGLRQEKSDKFALAKAELHVSRKDFEAFMAREDMSESDFAAEFAKEIARYRRHGFPIGAQLDMFAAPQDTVDDQVIARADGKRAGLRGADPKPPSYIAGVLTQDWMEGWYAGQTELGMRLQKADGILAQRAAAAEAAKKAGTLEADDDEEIEEDETDPEVVKRRAKALKDSGWTEPQPEEAFA